MFSWIVDCVDKKLMRRRTFCTNILPYIYSIVLFCTESCHWIHGSVNEFAFFYLCSPRCSRTIDTWDEFILLCLWKQNPIRWPPCCMFKRLREKVFCARNRRFGTHFMVGTESFVSRRRPGCCVMSTDVLVFYSIVFT